MTDLVTLRHKVSHRPTTQSVLVLKDPDFMADYEPVPEGEETAKARPLDALRGEQLAAELEAQGLTDYARQHKLTAEGKREMLAQVRAGTFVPITDDSTED